MVPKFTGTKCSAPINFGSVVIGGFSPRYYPPGTHTHLVPPAPAHTRDPLCSPTRWAQVLVSGSTGSYR